MAKTRSVDLRYRLSFEKRQQVNDEYGNTQSVFQSQFTIWAAIDARKFGGEVVESARLSGHQPYIITVRISSQTDLIGPDWRARDVNDGTEYAVRSIIVDDSGSFYEILAQTGGAQ